ncbi:hypothetical protein DBT_1226 [Dissulfuribacter thermophilus]|uniref:Uncharacterized protein n=1 Tax=Dissulfuribacter thermophilus TaxID=1156395 RepID=A0A1B9F6C0_9BACT|nr:hypothetical protein [Dissulfuribacter thermophilus]OCC15479.1 hypothetical protein DBT_1226 [Dissulfuribacter thermophilus]
MEASLDLANALKKVVFILFKGTPMVVNKKGRKGVAIDRIFGPNIPS